MKVLLDTNVFVSGVFWEGTPSLILNLWRQKKIKLILSQMIFEEYKEVLLDLNQSLHRVPVESILELVLENASFCHPSPLAKPICEDPDDDIFFECAASGKVDCLVSGDKKVLKLNGFQGIRVLTPRAFLNWFESGS